MNRRVLTLLLLLLPGMARAQEQLRVQGPTPAVVVLGSQARVDLLVEGRTADPRPPEVPAVDGLAVRVLGPSRQVFSSFDGRGRSEQVIVQYTLLLEPKREGEFAIPPFRLHTGTTLQTVPRLELRAVKELRGAEYGYLDVRLEKQRVYVHEPIRVRVEFGVDNGLRPVLDVASNGTRYVDFEIKAPWLSELEGALRIDEPEVQGDRTPVVLNRALQLAEFAPGHERAGRSYRSFVFHKSFLPVRAGTFELDGVLLRYHVQLTEGRRGLFGERIGGQSENYYVYGQPLRLEVLPIPEAGRPSPFYGAVGRFDVAAALDRDTVRVGSSVRLTLSIQGSGNFEFLRVPALDGLEGSGWHLLGRTEQRKTDRMTVTYDLTPLSAEVREVPAIEWNYFDTTPGVERFQTVTAGPLPVQVQPLANAEQLGPLPDAPRTTVTPGVDDIFDLPDLDGAPVLHRTVPLLLLLAAVFGPWLLVGALALFLAVRRRHLADPAAARARAAARTCQRALDRGVEPAAALAQYLADRLGLPSAAVIADDLCQRLAAAGVDAALAERAAGALERGIAARYGHGQGLDAGLVRELLQQLEAKPMQRLRAPLSTTLFLLSLPAFSGGVAPAQQPAVEAGYRAYRQGDYAAAEQQFAAALLHGGDRRLWFARGNCFFRLGDLPRALWAYECARLGMPRDRELLANLLLVRRQLGIDAGAESFGDTLRELRARVTAPELALLCAACMTAAAILLGLFHRRPLPRWLGILALLHGAVFAADLLWLGPARPPRAVALEPLRLYAEPRSDLQVVATVQPGVVVALRSSGSGSFARVDAGARSGYAPRQALAIVE